MQTGTSWAFRLFLLIILVGYLFIYLFASSFDGKIMRTFSELFKPSICIVVYSGSRADFLTDRTEPLHSKVAHWRFAGFSFEEFLQQKFEKSVQMVLKYLKTTTHVFCSLKFCLGLYEGQRHSPEHVYN